MDYAFVPGIGDYPLTVLSQMYSRRPHTAGVLTDPPVTLANFLSTVNAVIHLPPYAQAGDLLLGAHGSDEATLGLALDATNTAPADFEKIESATTIKIPAGLGTTSTNVRLGSCSLGQDDYLPLLRVLKKAMGVPSTVSSARFLHSFAFDGGDLLESMMYRFQVSGGPNGTPLPSRDAVIEKFTQANFKWLDRVTAVPSDKWDDWLPSEARLELKPNCKQEISFNNYVDTDRKFMNIPLPFDAGLYWTSLHEPYSLNVASNATPSDDAATAFLIGALTGNPLYDENQHPFPIPKRLGYDTLESFANAYKWTVTNASASKLLYSGYRYVYMVDCPVTEVGTDKWIYNTYPESDDPTIRFSETTRPELFGIV